ncbi:type III restriction endonuclease subunit R [Methylococcaceae bacterium CS5]|nr:type III restriction endonuclease subunit R [Methylococcaceae bacterium CS5]TXL06235.1 type III restriction endonuclease subunit R [Methylococcaceae bacterium CS2]
MKIQFDSELDYQQDAIKSVVKLFEGQETRQSHFTVPSISTTAQKDIFGNQNDLGVGNNLRIVEEDVLDNVKAIQLRNGLKQSNKLDSMDFTIEMETGTGKTYVYLRSIFELNQEFGFTKFIIVVPSIAIKEGVYKTLQITEQHFKAHYNNVTYDYFIYDSSKLGEIRNFATNDAIQVMVINIDAFRRSFTDPEKENKANIIHRAHDKMSGVKPIEFIQSTNPVVIIDEPQSVDATSKAKNAIASLNPLCTLRYSATHKEKYNLLYKLDSIDAYEQKLVKQIEVAHIRVEDAHNKAYIKLLAVDNKKSPITATVEFDTLKNGHVKRIKKKLKSGSDLFEESGGRSVYSGYIINEIYCKEDEEYIDFTSTDDVIQLQQAIGNVDETDYKRLQIRKTIDEHLNKELALNAEGIKVLSLFFLDKVSNYRYYDDDGVPQKGKYALIFEEEYRKAIKKPKYNSLFKEVDTESLVNSVHNGYFAIDNKKDSKGQALFKESKGEGTTLADGSAYELIMKDKEKLLSFDSKLKFIFSHTALKEGWDNPNVFQICTLNETASVMKKRQEIGRGLRIAVNQEGERVYGFNVNTLTVMANESYEDFVQKLQKEIEDEEGIRFGVVEKHLFSNIVIETDTHEEAYLGAEKSEQIWAHMLAEKYIDSKGKALDKLKLDLKNNTVVLPDDVMDYQHQITRTLKKVVSGLNIKDEAAKTTIKLNKAVYLGEDFKALWERIKYKTTFRVDFDVEKLVDDCAAYIQKHIRVDKTKFVYEKEGIKIERSGLEGGVKESSIQTYDIKDFQLPDIISHLQNETNLTRRTLVSILNKCGRLEDFKNNPQKFIDEVAMVIKRMMRQFIVDGIKYEKIGDDQFYAQELFHDNELIGYLDKNMQQSDKSIYDHVVYDSEVESEFAKSFEQSTDIKVYAKLPSWFKIDTPLGSYNPDWAVLVDSESGDKLYFVVETKGSIFSDMLRPAEQAKIDCGEAHFNALGSNVNFTVADKFETFAGCILK